MPGVKFDEHAGNRQAEPEAPEAMRAATGRVVALREGVEDPVHFIVGHTDSGISDHDRAVPGVFAAAGLDEHRSVARGEFLGVLEDVPKFLLEPRGVAENMVRAGGEFLLQL